MIPVTPQPKPRDFNAKVRIPGQSFLKTFSGHPSNKDYKRKGAKYWIKALDQLYYGYNKICAYSAEWIPKKQKSVDHFIPKSKDKNLAYEWNNFRLCLKQINENKDSYFVVDPFKIKFDWFIIDFDANIIKPNIGLNPILRAEIINTITTLGLNNLIFQNRRISWIDAYYRGITDFIGLQQKAPFIAHELKRQKLEEEIKVKHEKYLKRIGKI
ncbi:MAG: hypothetical protein WKF71_09070 [Pyrinomonadaceae bacterium]